jgi:hypothetical protein
LLTAGCVAVDAGPVLAACCVAFDVDSPHAATRSAATNVNDVRRYVRCPQTPRDAASVAVVFRIVAASFC